MAPSVHSFLVLLLFTLSMADTSTAFRCNDDIVSSCHITDPSFDPSAPSPENQPCVEACKECETSSNDHRFQPFFGNDGTFISYSCISATDSDPEAPPGAPPGFFFVSLFFRLILLLAFLSAYGCCLCVRRLLSDNVLGEYGLPPNGAYYGMAPFFPDNPGNVENNGRRATSSSRFPQKDKVVASEVPLGDSVMPLMVSQEDEIHSSEV